MSTRAVTGPTRPKLTAEEIEKLDAQATEEARAKWEPILDQQERESEIDLRLTERLLFLGLDPDLRFVVRGKVKIESSERGAIDEAIESALRDKPLEWGSSRKMLAGLRNFRW